MATAAAAAEQPFPLPAILHHAQTPPHLVTQGAEARLYKTAFLAPSRPAALKYRPSKPWRHPTLDARLTRARILAEARVLYKCHREGVCVPAVLALDDSAGWLMLEWIAGNPVRVPINQWLEKRHPAGKAPSTSLGSIAEDGATAQQQQQQQGGDDTPESRTRESISRDERLKDLMRRMGAAVGKLHKTGIVHGDLTTSNMMLRPPSTMQEDGDDETTLDGEIVLIDFGLASQSTADEDRAVDLYVLERAFGSTHPRAEVLFPELLEGYRLALPSKQATVVLRKLEDVRMRGRKRSMVG